ncbi:SUKH-4 family immunity protein [Actinacidiphila alni]|uniref:SUKH-4 family immunity protein n=1 Tax=Actinacidiphila alni TaxID=380248 RepID=UPI0034520FAF
MVTFAQAQERAERWINGDVPAYEAREIRVREFDLGFVVWSEPREESPAAGSGGDVRVVIARDSGEATLWPALPIGELIRRYEEEFGPQPNDAVPEPPQRIDLEATSFLLSPPQWLQDAADKMGIPDRRSSRTNGGQVASGAGAGSGPSAADGAPAPDAGPVGSGAAPDSGAGGADYPRPAPAGSGSEPGGVDFGRPAAAGSGSVDYRRPAAAGSGAGQDGAGGPAGADSGRPAAASPSGGIDYSRPTPAGAGSESGSRGVDFGRPAAASGPGAGPGGASGPADSGAGSGGIDYRRPAAASGAEPVDSVPAAPSAGGSADAALAGSGPGSGGIDYRRPAPADSAPAAPATPGGSWAGKTTSDSGEGQSVAVPATVFAPPISGSDRMEPAQDPAAEEARTELMPGGSSLPRTRIAPPVEPQAPVPPARPGVPHTVGGSEFPPPGGPAVALPPPTGGPVGGPVPPPGGAADIADLETAKAVRGSVLPPAGAPARSPDAPPPPPGPAAPAGGYLPTQMVPQNPGPPQNPQGPPPPSGGGDPHYAATMLAGPGGPPGPPGPTGPSGPPPSPPGPGAMAPPPPPAAGNDPHYAATMLAGPGGAPVPPPPGVGQAGPGAPGGNDPHYAATMLAGPGGAPMGPPPPGVGQGGPGGMAPPPGYGYPQAATVPTVGPGYMAVLRYRGQDGSEQQLIRRSAPGTPHPEWQLLHELRSLGVRPEQVLELHTELESCDLPGGYCTRMIRETWPQVRISHTAPYGRDHASRQQGVQHLLTHQGELHQVAGAPARPHPQRVPMPDPHTVLRVPPVPLDVIGQELAGAFGPQGLFRFDQRAVSRQGVPDIVAQTLVWAGLPVDFGPFFWAQAQPGQPVPTLAELAQQRGVQPAADAGSYLVMGNDFGRQLCVQFGTAHIVAVPLEAGPGGQPAVPQFVNSSLPEFARCLALLGRMWRLRIGLTPDQAGRWTVDFQAQLAAQDPAAIASPDHWWSVLIEQMWDGLL